MITILSLECNLNIQCRTFDFDESTLACRLFEGAFETGSVINNSLTSRVGFLRYFPHHYHAYNQSCSMCLNDRYLICKNQSCTCPMNSFWNGTICENQRYENQSCVNDDWCRFNQLSFKCSSRNLCSSKDTIFHDSYFHADISFLVNEFQI